MPHNTFFPWTHNLLVCQKLCKDTFFPTLHPLSLLIFATATVVAFVLLHNSRFNFHCYTQREAMPTQKSARIARSDAATSRDFLCERLQRAFTSANQLYWTAQYIQKGWRQKGQGITRYQQWQFWHEESGGWDIEWVRVSEEEQSVSVCEAV